METTINRACEVILLGTSMNNDHTRINCDLIKNGNEVCGHMIITLENNEIPNGIKIGDFLDLSLVISN